MEQLQAKQQEVELLQAQLAAAVSHRLPYCVKGYMGAGSLVCYLGRHATSKPSSEAPAVDCGTCRLRRRITRQRGRVMPRRRRRARRSQPRLLTTLPPPQVQT